MFLGRWDWSLGSLGRGVLVEICAMGILGGLVGQKGLGRLEILSSRNLLKCGFGKKHQ